MEERNEGEKGVKMGVRKAWGETDVKTEMGRGGGDERQREDRNLRTSLEVLLSGNSCSYLHSCIF